MIKKILSTLLVSSVLLVFAVTNSMAERPTFAAGVSQAFGGYEASGTEKEGAGSPQETSTKTISGAMAYSTLFVEMSFKDRVTIGASWMVDSIQTNLSSRTDSLCGGAVLHGSCGEQGDDGNDTGTSSVKAEFSNLVTGYVELNIWNGLYAKYGIMEMDLETKESLHTDSSYPNATMDGSTYGLGWKGSFDNGVFIKTETLMQDWTDITLLGDGATGTDNNTSVTASLQGAVATISVGRAF